MSTPFTTEQFLDVFVRYNQAVWPVQAVLYLLGVGMAALAFRRREGRAIGAGLALLWAWMGLVYHWGFFSAINPAAWMFGALFVVEALLLLDAGVLRPRLTFRARGGAAGIAGMVLVAYALFGYSLLGYAFGQEYPRTPTFGLPCPTVIFTFGLLLWAEGAVPVRLLLVPAAWSALGAFAAFQHGIAQDYGLLVAGLAATPLLVWRARQASRDASVATVRLKATTG